MHRSFFPVLLGLAAVLVTSCDKNRVFDEYKSLPGEWNKDSVVAFKIENIDTLQNYDLFINVRNNNDFGYSNLFLIAQIQFPYGKVITDTLEYQMAAPGGEWLGTGFGDVKESKLWYKEQVKFNEPGHYEVTLRHAMRKSGSEEGINDLEGITQVGIRIENTQN